MNACRTNANNPIRVTNFHIPGTPCLDFATCRDPPTHGIVEGKGPQAFAEGGTDGEGGGERGTEAPYLKGALRYLKGGFEGFEGILRGLRSLRRYLKGTSTRGTLSLCRRGGRGG